MATLPLLPPLGKASVFPVRPGFHGVVAPFLQQPGLPFADVLSADAIERAFAQRDALFATDAIFSTPLVLWAFLAQVLRDGKGAACAAAVADIATYQLQTGQPVPCGDTGDYCRARAKLDLGALRALVAEGADHLERDCPPGWLWHGLHPKLIDGFTFTMPDTPDNQREFPQPKSQRPGRRTEEIVVVTSLTDPQTYPAEAIAELYGYRWNAEVYQSYYDPCHTFYHMEVLDLGWVRLAA